MEEAIRGGISMTPGRYGKANHKYLHDYDQTKPSSYIVYWDANNLYGYAMSQPLPYGGYEWIRLPSECNAIFDSLKDGYVTENDPHGYIFEVDGYFPEEVHDYLKDFPLCPEKETVQESMISPYSQKLNEQFKIKHDYKSTKLLCTLLPKTKYKVHYRNLLLYIQLGFVVTKVHRVMRFLQMDWMKSFINHNTSKRALATNTFLKDFYKLINNSSYGKMIQNNRKHTQICVIKLNTPKQYWDPFLKDRRIVNENLVFGYLKKGQTKCDSPLPVGAVILEHSKWLMYDFFYNTVKKIYEDKVRLLFTDTDSLCLQIETEDIMKDIMKHKMNELMDMSDWPKNDNYYGTNYHSNQNKKVVGKFKDEMVDGNNSTYINEVIALRSKMYSCLKDNDHIKATAKGVSRSAQQGITHEHYRKCLFTDEQYQLEKAEMWKINSQNNNLYLTKNDKITLSPCDSKCYLLDATHTICYGHYSIPSSS